MEVCLRKSNAGVEDSVRCRYVGEGKDASGRPVRVPPPCSEVILNKVHVVCETMFLEARGVLIVLV